MEMQQHELASFGPAVTGALIILSMSCASGLIYMLQDVAASEQQQHCSR